MTHTNQASLISTLLISICIVGCDRSANNVSQGPATSDSAKTGVQEGGGIAATIKNQKDIGNTFDEVEVLPDDINDLMSYLSQKQTEQLRPKDDAESYRIQKQRALASTKLLDMKLTGDQRFECVRIRVDALLKLIAAGDPQAKIDLQKDITRFSKDGRPQIRQVVLIGGLINDYRESANQSSPNMAPLIDAALQIVSDHPDSFDVCKEIGMIAEQMLQQGDRDSWIQLTGVLVNGYENSANETSRNYVKRLAARRQVASANLDLIVNEIKNQVPDALKKYREAVHYLFADRNLSLTSLEPIVGSLSWLENTGMTSEALEANRIVMTAGLEIANRDVRAQLRAHCEKRDVRLGLIGKPFSISAMTARGDRLEWQTFAKDHPVVVVFWSPSEPASVKLVEHLSEVYKSNKSRGLKLLAVSLSNEADSAGLFGDSLPEWEIAIGNPTLIDGPSEFIQMYGISRAPQILLVDRSGTVVAVNPNVVSLDSQIGDLLE